MKEFNGIIYSNFKKSLTGLLLLLFMQSVLCPPSSSTERGIGGIRKYFLSADSRTALVIGNSAYESAPLKNPVNDAQDITRVLRDSDFDVTLIMDANQREMEREIRKFGKKLQQKGGSGLFYYAGHGLQVRGSNYIVPVDAIIESEADVKYETIDMGLILGKMEDAENDLNIIIFDACRNNPYVRGFRSAEQGLAKMDTPTGSLLSYSTAPGSVAGEGDGRNGVFTKYLLHYMKTPGLKVEEVMKNVRIAVVKETSGKQVPWDSSSLMGNFYFFKSAPVVKDSATPQEKKVPQIVEKGSSDNFEDIKTKLEADKNKWAAWQQKMNKAFEDVKLFDSSKSFSNEEKEGAWQKFLTIYNVDNAYSDEDEKYRSRAQTRVARLTSTSVGKKDTIKPAIEPVVIDGEQGVMWQKNPTKEQMTYPDAKRYCTNLKLSNFSDWQIPTSFSLSKLIKKNEGPPTIDPKLFPATQEEVYWTSDFQFDSSMDCRNHDLIDFLHGEIAVLYICDNHFEEQTASVRCVRRDK